MAKLLVATKVGYGKDMRELYFKTDKKTYIIFMDCCLDDNIDHFLIFLINIRHLLQGKEHITINAGNVYIKVDNSIIECLCVDDSETYKFMYRYSKRIFACNVDDVLQAFDTCYTKICYRLFATPKLWKPYCRKWFLFGKSFERQLTKAIDENPYDCPIAILENI